MRCDAMFLHRHPSRALGLGGHLRADALVLAVHRAHAVLDGQELRAQVAGSVAAVGARERPRGTHRRLVPGATRKALPWKTGTANRAWSRVEQTLKEKSWKLLCIR